MTEETPSHFRIALGGNVRCERTEVGAGVDVPIASSGYKPRSPGKILNCRVSAGGKAKIKLVKQEGSMSVLIPGNGPLSYRACLEDEKAKLICWFANIEVRAWEWVNAVFNNPRPGKIFLVTGQTLTPEYNIAHQDEQASDCEILLEPSIGIGEVVKGSAMLGYQLHRVSASLGFRSFSSQTIGQTILHSVFIEIFESKVIRRLRFEVGSTLQTRIGSAFQSIHHVLVVKIRYFKKRKDAQDVARNLAIRMKGQASTTQAVDVRANSLTVSSVPLSDNLRKGYTGEDPNASWTWLSLVYHQN